MRSSMTWCLPARRLRAAALLAAAGAAGLLSTPAAAQLPMTPRALGMGGAYLGAARGQEALFLNPANLALPGTPRWSVALAQVGLQATLLGLSFDDLADLADYHDLADARRDALFAKLPASGTEVRYDLRLPLAALQVGRVAVGVAYSSLGEHNVSKDLAELFLYGYEEGRLDYDVRDTEGRYLTFYDVALAVGGRAGPLRWGVAGHYLRGGSLVRSWMAEPRYDLAARDVEARYVAVSSRGGHGVALDVGAALQPTQALTLSAALANAFATLRWSDELYLRELVLDKTDLETAGREDLLERYEDSERRLSPADSALVRGLTAARLQEGAVPPTQFRLGAGWQATRSTHLGALYQVALTDGDLAGHWQRMVGAGVEQALWILRLRAGVAGNFSGGSLLGGGLSLGPLHLGLARLDDGARAGGERNGWMATFGVATRTRATLP